MEITLEMAERLKEKANVTYAQAKEALEYSGGNMLDALIYLEEKGAIPRQENAYYSTKSETPPPSSPADPPPVPLPARREKREKGAGKPPHADKKGAKWFFHTLRRWLIDNELEIWRRSEPVTSIPVLFLVISLVVAFRVMVVLLVLGLFLGFRYQFSGPDLNREELNGVMDNVATTAEEMGRRVAEELKSQHDKHSKKQ